MHAVLLGTFFVCLFSVVNVCVRWCSNFLGGTEIDFAKAAEIEFLDLLSMVLYVVCYIFCRRALKKNWSWFM